MDASTGLLRGVPDTAGETAVLVKVTLERPIRQLDEVRLSWGQESVKDVVREKVGGAMQNFRVAVNP
jgi:hypothetical protein